MILFAGVRGFIDRIDVSSVTAFEKAWLAHCKNNHYDATLGAIKNNKFTISPEMDKKFSELCDEFTSAFQK